MTKMRRGATRVAGMVLLVMVLSGFTNDERFLFDAVNHLRATEGHPRLEDEAKVNARAEHWAATLARSGRLRHSDLRTLPGPFRGAAENVAYAATVQQVHEMLAASPLHRLTMLDPAYTGVGIGTARGRNGLVYAVEVFYRR